MPSDLWYFHETDLSKKNLNSFVKSLPNHLQRMFEDSFGGFNFVDKDVANVLQGYRGPHIVQGSGISEYLGPSNGLQEVRYWWGISKNLMFLGGIGLLAFGINRAVQNTDWHSLYFDSKTGECLSHSKNEAIEKLNNKGNQLFQDGKYAEAAEYYKNAYLACSSGYKNEATFKNNRDRAETECEASKLNSQGDKLFTQGVYTEAVSIYQEAYDKSMISKEYNKYQANREKAKAEREAMNLVSEGDDLFGQSKYGEALNKYLEAYNKSKVHKDYIRDKRDQARTEVDAINLSMEGDKLFKEDKYSEALNKYQSAYDKSIVGKEKNVYAASRNNVQALKNKLVALDTLWKEALEAENDTEKDKSSQATQLFQRVLSETKDAVKEFPGSSRFKQYETLISLKIDGNELFNEGLELQQDGVKLLQEAQELKLQLRFKLAHIKFMEAKSKFSKAQEKFEIGKEKDERFVSCVDFVQDQLNEILRLTEVIEQQAVSLKFLSLDVSISGKDHSEVNSCLGDTTEDHNNYYEQI